METVQYLGAYREPHPGAVPDFIVWLTFFFTDRGLRVFVADPDWETDGPVTLEQERSLQDALNDVGQIVIQCVLDHRPDWDLR